LIENLFFAGQINGTTGYEEAACQGLIAGINAHHKVNEKDEFILKRDEAYIGVLIDDLITKGTEEPYRMFTSRAEYRLLLRQDNADERLTPRGYEIGLASKQRMINLENKLKQTDELIEKIKNYSVSGEEINSYLEEKESNPIKQRVKLNSVITRPNIKLQDLLEVLDEKDFASIYEDEIIQLAETNIKYEGYIKKEKENVNKLYRLENIKIPKDFDFSKLNSITTEARQKFEKIKPETIGQASRISGVSPSDISVLLIYLGR
jgi:tRNA uridine 5-carboxymethylaminomethyl modification enzyme